jgi:hypothetical protein
VHHMITPILAREDQRRLDSRTAPRQRDLVRASLLLLPDKTRIDA